MGITEITGLDVNDTDKVYSSESGYFVKVRVLRMSTGAADRLNFRITGSLCDDQGYALSFEDGHFIVPAVELAPHSETVADIVAEVEEARLDMVRRVERAAINQAAAEAI